MRKDAERNRERLVRAARELLRDRGGDLPLEEIAERAGVGRGTLYRNFAHRAELYLAVLDDDLAQMHNDVATDTDGAIFDFIKRFAEMTIYYGKFLQALPELPDFRAEGDSMVKMRAALSGPLERAQRDGVLREDLTTGDLIMACRMMATSWHLDGAANRDAALERRLGLLMRGMAGTSPAGRTADESVDAAEPRKGRKARA